MGRKKKPLKKQKTYTLIVCEGETEENYINNVIRPYLRQNENHARFKCKKFKSISSIIGFLTKPEQPCDAVFLVCDLDECTTDNGKIPYYCDQEYQLFNNKKLIKFQKASFYSYPSIEYWYLLHCEANYTPTNGTSHEVEIKFQTHLPNYEKPMPRNETEAAFFNERINDAIENENALRESNPEQLPFAVRLRPANPESITNPMSELGKLISELNKVKPNN